MHKTLFIPSRLIELASALEEKSTPKSLDFAFHCREAHKLLTEKTGRGITEGKNSDNLPTTDQSRRVASIMHRRHETPWTDREVVSYRKLGRIPEDDLASVERYYAANWPPRMQVNQLRHDLSTLLNNWPGEVGKAAAWVKACPRSAAAAGEPKKPTGEPDGFRAWFKEEYPRANPRHSWEEIPDDIKERFKSK